jgi:hypothetical protein
VFIINIVGFDFAWFGLVYWGNSFIPVALLLLCFHFYFVSKKKLSEFYLICAVTTIGIYVDATLQHFGVFVFPNDVLMPFWLVILWFCFASTLCHSLKFLQGSKLLQGLVGGLCAPISYFAGNEMNAVSFGLTATYTFIILSIVWGALMVVFFSIKSILIDEEVPNVEVLN